MPSSVWVQFVIGRNKVLSDLYFITLTVWQEANYLCSSHTSKFMSLRASVLPLQSLLITLEWMKIALSFSEHLTEVSGENPDQDFGVWQRPTTWLVELSQPIKSYQTQWNVEFRSHVLCFPQARPTFWRCSMLFTMNWLPVRLCLLVGLRRGRRASRRSSSHVEQDCLHLGSPCSSIFSRAAKACPIPS